MPVAGVEDGGAGGQTGRKDILRGMLQDRPGQPHVHGLQQGGDHLGVVIEADAHHITDVPEKGEI